MNEQKLKNEMRKIKVAKITLNFGAGTDQKLLEKGVELIKHVTGIEPVKTFAKKRVPSWKLRVGLPIGCKVTLRGKQAAELLPRLLSAKENRLKARNFDNQGNVSFGVPEYIDIEGVKYNPDLGMMGLEVAVTLERPGFRLKKRRIRKGSIPARHRIAKEDAITFMKDKFKVEVEE